MRRAAVLMLAAFSLSAFAASGSWSDTQHGITLQNRGVMMSSVPLTPAASAPVRAKSSASITTVSWQYQLTGPRPAGLQVQLCNTVNRCVSLDDGSGQTRAFWGQPAGSPLRFVFFVPGHGAMSTPLRVVSQQVIVNYQ